MKKIRFLLVAFALIAFASSSSWASAPPDNIQKDRISRFNEHVQSLSVTDLAPVYQPDISVCTEYLSTPPINYYNQVPDVGRCYSEPVIPYQYLETYQCIVYPPKSLSIDMLTIAKEEPPTDNYTQCSSYARSGQPELRHPADPPKLE